MNLINRLMMASEERELCHLVQQLLTTLFEGETSPDDIFTADYQQVTDGHVLHYSDFLQHLQHVRSQIRHMTFRVEQACYHRQLLADRHTVTVTYPDNQTAKIEVYMFARLREGKIYRIDEVTRLLSGRDTDKSLASAVA